MKKLILIISFLLLASSAGASFTNTWYETNINNQLYYLMFADSFDFLPITYLATDLSKESEREFFYSWNPQTGLITVHGLGQFALTKDDSKLIYLPANVLIFNKMWE